MNFSKAQVAALVLGYLKSERLQSVVDEFTKCSCYLTENNEKIKIGKYFVTRVAGMTLVDILEQYSVIYAIVQSRLEETNYFELHSRTTLAEQLLYLLDRERVSSPLVSLSSEVDATPAHSLPGNSSFAENENSPPRTPKKRNTRGKNKEKEEIVDMTEVLTQSLLENHELHEKIAETINIVRNTPEVAKTTLEDRISTGASKEIDAVIKTVIQRTEEDPTYNKLIDEIIGGSGSTPFENPPIKKPPFCSTPHPNMVTSANEALKAAQNEPNMADPMDDHNNDAIRSIIEAAQNPEPPPPSVTSPKVDAGGEVYVFEGSLDTYLKTSGATNSLNTNPVFINPGGLIVMPPSETASNQFYMVNNQPVIKMNMPTVLTEKEFMSIPTVLVNDECKTRVESAVTNSVQTTVSSVTSVSNTNQKRSKPVKREPVTEVVTIADSPIESTGASRLASHVRNLDFSTPSCTKKAVPWDTNLRVLISDCKDKSPSPKRRRLNTKKKKTKKTDDEKNAEEREKAGLQTPVKAVIPKTPGGALDSTFHCTPFNDVIDDHLKGVDLNSIPTPSLPITPGFALTPGDMVATNHRSTDYSTSSSYYQPSEPEPPKSTDDLMEELRGFENRSPSPEKSHPKIISNVVITPGRVESKKPYMEHVNKFNSKVIGKKNLNLIKQSSSSSSSSSDSESEDGTNSTVVSNTAVIKDIISNVEVKKTLGVKKGDKGQDNKQLLSSLETVRQRTVRKLSEIPKKQPRRTTKKPPPKIPSARAPRAPKAKTKKNEEVEKVVPTPKASKAKTNMTVEQEKNDEHADLLVKDLAKRGIHLMHKKAPQKNIEPPENAVDDEVIFDTKTFDCEISVREDKAKRRNLRSYDFKVLTRTISAKVTDDNDQETTRIIKWTDCHCVYDSRNDEYDELMDFSVTAAITGGSPKTDTKGGRKRKSKFLEEETKKEKNKTFASCHELLNKIGMEDFLNKVHGE